MPEVGKVWIRARDICLVVAVTPAAYWAHGKLLEEALIVLQQEYRCEATRRLSIDERGGLELEVEHLRKLLPLLEQAATLAEASNATARAKQEGADGS